MSSRPTIAPSTLGSFVDSGMCPMYAKLLFDEDADTSQYKEGTRQADIIASEYGNKFEFQIFDNLREAFDNVKDSWPADEQKARVELRKQIDEVEKTGEPLLLLHPPLYGGINVFSVEGEADAMVLEPTEDGVEAGIYDVKSSKEEKTAHQIQTATYSILLKSLFSSLPLQYNLSITTGIILEESSLSDTIDELPSFDHAPREADVRRLLEENGPIDSVLSQDESDVEYQHDSACYSCDFNERCYTKTVESQDIRMLELSRAEQRVLRKHGLNTLEDVAKLINPPSNPRPFDYKSPDIKSKHESVVKDVREEHAVGERLPELAQEARAYLSRIKPDSEHAHDAPYNPWIIGTGRGTLPDDNPPEYFEPSTEKRGELVRAYLNVQYDYARDEIVGLAARISCTNDSEDDITLSKTVDTVDEESDEEKSLLTSFGKDLLQDIWRVADRSGNPDKAPIHFYVYSQQELDALTEATKRHSETKTGAALHDLLGLRKGIDQQFVSVVEEEVESRLALKQPSSGLIEVVNQFYPQEDIFTTPDSWKYEENGQTIDLRTVFHRQLFDYNVPFTQDNDKALSPLLDGEGEPDTFYPSRMRKGAQIPLQYVWGSQEIDELHPDWSEDESMKARIESYRWHNRNEKDNRVRKKDIETLMEQFTAALAHVERGIQYKNYEIEKPPLDLNQLSSFSLGDSTLRRGCREYLDLEYNTQYEDCYSHYQKPLRQRILSGESVPVEVVSAESHGYYMEVEAKLIYDEFDFSTPIQVAKSSSITGSSGSSSGDRMVATELSEEGGVLDDEASSIENYFHSPRTSIDAFNPENGTARLVSYRYSTPERDQPYVDWHKSWTTDPADRGVLFEEGDKFILDPLADDSPSDKTIDALNNAEKNPLYNLLEDIRTGVKSSTKSDNLVPEKGLEEYMSWLETEYEPTPNARQSDFITLTDSHIGLLQGPPGTGKSSGAIAHSTVGRAKAHSRDGSRFRAFVTAPSNTAINEVMEDVASVLNEYQSDNTDLQDVKLIRLSLDKPAPEDRIDGVEYLEYHDDDDAIEELANRLVPEGQSRQSTFQEHTDNQIPHTVVFGTPSRIQSVAMKMLYIDEADAVYSASPNFADYLVVDEASMMDLPRLFTSSAFLSEDFQALISGDQRQMPPVQSYEWTEETRRTIRETIPYLSSLDFCRFLRGDTVDRIPENTTSPNAEIPLVQLRRTYRCHTAVTEFLKEWMYIKDDIEYTSEESETIITPTSSTEGIDVMSNPDSPIVVAVHDDVESQKTNLSEAKMAANLTEVFDNSTSVGVVTPHNAQKGLLQMNCSPESEVDTVERFQGGEKDAMILSATVSDPDFQGTESEFLLNPNRLNVALSRMQKKLVVLVPESLFQMLPRDADEYEDSILWRGLHALAVANGSPDWSGPVENLVGDEGDETHVDVYALESGSI